MLMFETTGILPSEEVPASIVSANTATKPLRIDDIASQTKTDLFSTKDVQDVATASYVWLADQVGHVFLGLAPTLLLCWGWRACAHFLGVAWPEQVFGYMIAAAVPFMVWVYKEWSDYRATLKRMGVIFPADTSDIVWNVKTALAYFAIGGALGAAAFVSWQWFAGVLVLSLWPALTIAHWWLKRKIAFQQSGCPFLYRLANFPSHFVGNEAAQITAIEEISTLAKCKVWLWKVMLGIDSARPGPGKTPEHLLLTGPLGSGKTSLAIGIATEFAFSLGLGRFMSTADLAAAVAKPLASGKPILEDGRLLWRLADCDLLVVDNLDITVSLPVGAPHALVKPAAFDELLRKVHPGKTLPLADFATRRTVWVVGDTTSAWDWQKVLAGLMGIKPATIRIIELAAPPIS